MTRYATFIVVMATILTGFASPAHAWFDSPQILAQTETHSGPTIDNPGQHPKPSQQPSTTEQPEDSDTHSTSTDSAVPVEQFESPTEKGEVKTDLFFVTEISVQTPADPGVSTSTEKITFKGYAAPYAQVTLFIYSTPIIVTVTANAQGVWAYELDRELEDGRHTMYVAQVDNSGKIVAKTDPIFFTKTEAQIEVEPSESVLISAPRRSIVDSYFILTVSIIFIFALIVTITIIGLMHKRPV
jgi:hypothetical protein